MHLKQIILDGFKSYANRTVIDGFDERFNAITGQNGSGKSNVLDAICFVLGISNLSQVRASELKDLVYKSGQARVTKCSVTLVFDNTPSAKSPQGYSDHKELTVTRQYSIAGNTNKYLINGKVATQTRVQELFKSVQLNVNNPQFLIMQGRITKVCNMKPHELLGLLEETSGVKNYEEQRNTGLRKLQNRETKLQEIEDSLAVLRERRDDLEEEKKRYNRSEQLHSRVEKTRRFVDALNHFTTTRRKAENESALKTTKQTVADTALREVGLTEQITALKDAIGLSSSSTSSTKEKELVANLNASNLSLARVDATSKILQNKLISIRKEISQLQAKVEAGKERMRDDITVRKLEKELVEARERFTGAKSLVDSLNASVSGALASEDGGKGQTLRGQLMECERELQRLAATIQQARTQLRSIEQKKKRAEQQADNERGKQVHSEKQIAEREYQARQRLLRLQSDSVASGISILQPEARRSSIVKTEMTDDSNEGIGGDVSTSGFTFPGLRESILNGSERARLQDNALRLENQARQQNDIVERGVSEVNNRLAFHFTPWTNPFDHSRIKGPLAKLISVRDQANAYALEIAAGARLYQIVVDNDTTGSDLLKHGHLRNRITIIPLNKISGQRIDNQLARAVRDLVGDKATPAIDLVGFESGISAAAEYAFGRTFVCSDVKAAETIAYTRSVACKAVTVNGDVYDPLGTITGGSRTQTFSVLTAVASLNEERHKLDELQNAAQNARREFEVFASIESAAHEYASEVENVRMLRTSLQSTSYATYLNEAKELNIQIERLQEEISTLTHSEAVTKDRAETLRSTIASIEMSAANNDQKALERQLEKSRAKLQLAEADLQQAERALDVAKEQEESTAGDVAGLEKAVLEAKEKAVAVQAEIEENTTKAAFIRQEIEARQNDINVELSQKKELTRKIEENQKERRRLQTALDEVKDILKEYNRRVKELAEHIKFQEKELKTLVERSPWIARELVTFNLPDTEFDFTGKNLEESREELEMLVAEHELVQRSLNKTAAMQFDRVETTYRELRRKRDQIISDRENITTTISELDVHKDKMLHITWQEVNDSLGRIFTTLLPDANAMLEPHKSPEGMLVGVELRVAFGGRWKDSLSELSGGQRSLLALSLILSLLLYKPAPMYILDEVDAALDLAHTQNIGTVIKKEFSMSQFIIVSLKEGMFNNANVLFRTKFQDGISSIAVERSNEQPKSS